MLFRRVVGVFASLLTIELVLAGGELICLQHDGHTHHARAVAVSDTPDASQHHSHGGGHTQQHRHAPGDFPSPLDCCQAMSSCSTSLAVRSCGAALSVAVVQGPAFSSSASVPASRTTAPEPPPPRA